MVGLAVAAALARAGRPVVLFERDDGFGRETTSRNSQVVHAGLYYPEGSRKARSCVRGRELLYERCAREGLPHRRLGKWVVACEDAELGRLEALCARGTANGAPGLRIVDGAELARAEPCVRGVAALHSPSSGIVDAAALCLSLAAEAEAHGATLLRRTAVVAIEPAGAGYRLVAETDGERSAAQVAAVVNAAGLAADRVGALVGLDAAARGEATRFCKGDYFALAPAAGVTLSRLVYPLPSGAGLGIHATLDLGGRIRLGPDAEFVAAPRYDVDPAKAGVFADAAARYLPALGGRADWLTPDQAGVRPRLAGPGEAPRDFVVREESAAGRPGFVTLAGIESPGLTAALAIGEEVASLLRPL